MRIENLEILITHLSRLFPFQPRPQDGPPGSSFFIVLGVPVTEDTADTLSFLLYQDVSPVTGTGTAKNKGRWSVPTSVGLGRCRRPVVTMSAERRWFPDSQPARK